MRTVLALAAVAALVTGAAAQEVYKPGNGVSPPVLVREVKPQYTQDAKDRKVQGRVEMQCVVETDGTVGEEITILTSLDPDLDRQAIAALRQWRFRPGTKDGKAVRVQVNVEMTFTLR